jgi:alpha/beta superfamily hydrolase
MADDRPPRRLELRTGDGVVLEAEAVVPTGARGAVVLAHPHPLHGGTMRSLITSELFAALPGRGLAVLRFNFRGVEGSGGTHGDGHDEVRDVEAAVAELARRAPGVPLVIAGWSFGGDTSLAVTDDRVAGWFPIAPPLRILPLDELVASRDPRPKLAVIPGRDQINPPETALPVLEGWRNTRAEVIEGGDHLLVGRTDEVADLLVAFVDELAPTP